MHTAEQRNAVLDRAVSKAGWRLVPALIVMYMLSYLDRANIGFAKQSFQASTGVTEMAFAFGASIFFIGYALFEFSSNLMLHKVGARRWLARIMITWGLVATFMLFAKSDSSFYIVRFLLGSAEAGFFPGAILFMTYWFPAKARGGCWACSISDLPWPNRFSTSSKEQIHRKDFNRLVGGGSCGPAMGETTTPLPDFVLITLETEPKCPSGSFFPSPAWPASAHSLRYPREGPRVPRNFHDTGVRARG